MSVLPPTVRVNATEAPSGEIAGSDSTPASSVIWWNASGSEGADAAPGASARPAKNAAAASTNAPAMSAIGRRRGVAREAIASAATRPLAPLSVDVPDSACSANARSRADWKRSSGCFSRQWRMTGSIAAGDEAPSRVTSGGSSRRMAVIVSAAVSR